jgi:Concanavalin A-like lectin/glucanases superfamily
MFSRGIGLVLLAITVAAIAIVLGIQIHDRTSAVRLSLSFNGTLEASNGIRPTQSGGIDFSAYLHRKVLQLHPMQQVQYDLRNFHLKQGAISFWVKPDVFPPEEPVTFLSLSDEHSKTAFELRWKRRTLQLLTPANLYKLAPKSFSPGRWIYISIFWDTDSRFRVYWDGSELSLQETGGRPPLQITTSGKLTILCNSPSKETFGMRIRDFVLSAPSTADTNGNLKPEEQTVWRATDLLHSAGTKISAWGASRQEGWTGDSLMLETGALQLPSQGEFLVQWRIKPLGKIDPGTIEAVVKAGNEILGSHKNTQGELTNNAFQDWVVPFTAPDATSVNCELRSYVPIKYAFLVDAVTVKTPGAGWGKHIHVEDLHVHMGKFQGEPDAERGKALHNEDTLTYGPYACIGQPGSYRATWRIKISETIPEKTPLLFLDVFAHDGFLSGAKRGNKTYSQLALNTASFTKRDSWEEKSMDFYYDGADMLEFRTFTRNFQPGAIVIDTIAVRKLP